MSIDYDNYNNGGLLADRYLKVEDISEGSYGIVSLAKDTKSNDRLVAVKYITQFVRNNDKNDDRPNGYENHDNGKIEANFLRNENGNVDCDGLEGKSNINREKKKKIDKTVILEEAKQEIDILHKLNSHPHITTLYDSFDTYLILEYCSRGDMYEIIRSHSGPTSTSDVIDVMSQLIDAVQYAHSLGIYHRDIKPENILVSEDWSVKLTDWGLATTEKICTDFDVGSERYMAPELFDHKNTDSYDAEKCDIWSLGICLLNIVFGKNPFTVANPSDKVFVNFAANRETLFDIFPTMSYELFGVLRSALTFDPSNRNLDTIKHELSTVKHLTLDYDLEPALSDNDSSTTTGDIQVTREHERSKSIPAISSPERKLIHGNRKPLAIPITHIAYNHYNGNNNHNTKKSNNFDGNYHRQDYFTPKTGNNKYWDRIDKTRKDLKNIRTPRFSYKRNVNNNNNNNINNNKNNNNGNNHNQARVWRKSKSFKRPNANNNRHIITENVININNIDHSKEANSNSKHRGSFNSFSSGTSKYVPPSLRSPHLYPTAADSLANDSAQELMQRGEVVVDEDVIDDEDFDDDLFMLEEHRDVDQFSKDLEALNLKDSNVNGDNNKSFNNYFNKKNSHQYAKPPIFDNPALLSSSSTKTNGSVDIKNTPRGLSKPLSVNNISANSSRPSTANRVHNFLSHGNATSEINPVITQEQPFLVPTISNKSIGTTGSPESTPVMSTSVDNKKGVYVPPHHRRKSHSAVVGVNNQNNNNNSGFVKRNMNRFGFSNAHNNTHINHSQIAKKREMKPGIEHVSSSVPTITTNWFKFSNNNNNNSNNDNQNKHHLIGKINESHDKNFDEEFDINDMYHTFSKMSTKSSDKTVFDNNANSQGPRNSKNKYLGVVVTSSSSSGSASDDGLRNFDADSNTLKDGDYVKFSSRVLDSGIKDIS